VHALEQSGKKREALVLLWEILVSNVVVLGTSFAVDDEKKQPLAARDVWSELYQRIENLSDAVDIVNESSSNNNNGLDIQLMDAVQRLDVRAYAPIALPKGSSGASLDNNNTSKDKAALSSSGKHAKNSKGSSKSKKSKPSSSQPPPSISYYPPVTDETVLQTLMVTLRIEGLYDTMSEMYFQAMETLSSNKKSSYDYQSSENYKSVLEEGVCVHFKAVCDCSSVGLSKKGEDDDAEEEDGVVLGGKGTKSDGSTAGNARHIVQAQLPKLETLLNLTKYYERMQTSSLQLFKLSAQPLHSQWTAIASLWYKEGLQELVSTLEKIQSLLLLNNDDECGASAVVSKENEQDDTMMHLQNSLLQMMGLSNTTSDITTHCQKLKQKMALLPRLAETLSSRMVLQPSGKGKEEQQQQQHAVSENDWDVYLETLLVQGKKAEALDVLKRIQGTPMMSGVASGSSSGDGENTDKNSTLPQIDDEHTIENHVGSILPYTQRKKLERMAQLSQELGMYDQAEGYYRELLGVFPDQWTYWLGLVDSCVRMESSLSSSSTSPSSSSSGDDSSKEHHASMNDEGWKRCQSFAEQVISTVESSQKYALRGPYLILLELASVKVRQASPDGKEGLVTSLRNEICRYGNKFGPLASCCFADVRSYLRVLVEEGSSSSGPSDIPKDVLHVLQWAKELWTSSYQSNGAADGGGPSEGGDIISPDEVRERRKKIRTFIFAVQVVYGIAAVELDNNSTCLQLLQTYAPSISEMVTEWRTSLSFLPGVAPNDGGQKEVLPGDEIILLTSQYLQFQAKTTTTVQQSSNNNSATSPFLLQAVSLLEEAIDQSPYNPHLKIAAIGIYSQLHAAHRALTIYQDLGVKQIQLDSCSYLILPTLIQGGLYTSAIKLSSSILRLHGETSKQVKDYATKSLRNGLLFKAKEMATFQREKMRPSLQLLHSKGLVMDAAALMIPSDLGSDIIVSSGVMKQKGKSLPPVVRLGAEKGFCGSDEDLARAEQIAIDAERHFNAPAIIHAAAQSSAISVDDFVSSDNRDMTVNYFEILHHNSHYLTQKEMVTESLRRGHMHGLLTRAVMATGAANAPKKGKIPKPTEETTYRCQSLRRSLSRANEFGQEIDHMDDVDRALWEACCQLCEAIIIVIHGGGGDGKKSPNNDTLAEREKAAVSIVDSTMQLVQSARKAFTSYCCSTTVINQGSDCSSSIAGGARVCQLLPDRVVPFYALLETTARLFSLFGWGKRKRSTKAASGALANLALSFRDLLSDMLQAMSEFRSFGSGGDNTGDNMTSLESLVESAVSLDVVGADAIQRVIREVVSSRDMTKDRVDPFLMQMKESLESFDEQ